MPAVTPTPTLNAVDSVAGILAWFVWLVTLASPLLAVEVDNAADVDITVLDDCGFEVEADELGLTTEPVLVITDPVLVITEPVLVITEPVLVITGPVLVCCSPTTPIMVCAVPSETSNIPFPVLQLHVPSALSGWQHHLLSPHGMTEPLLAETGSPITTSQLASALSKNTYYGTWDKCC